MTQTKIRKEQILDLPFTVVESDGSPTVYPVDKIIFSGAVVEDLGNGDVLVTITGSGVVGGSMDYNFALAMAVAL